MAGCTQYLGQITTGKGPKFYCFEYILQQPPYSHPTLHSQYRIRLDHSPPGHPWGPSWEAERGFQFGFKGPPSCPDPPAHGSDLGTAGGGCEGTGPVLGWSEEQALVEICVAHRFVAPSPSSASHPSTPTEFLVYKIVPPAPTATLWGLRNPGTHSPYRGKEGRARAGRRGLRREGVGRGKWQRTGRGSRLYFLFL